MNTRLQLLHLLADGRFRSGAQLGQELGVSRNSVWKHMHQLRRWGLEVHSVRGRGHRLAAPLELLDSDRIVAGLSPFAREALSNVHVHLEVDSTNRVLLNEARSGLPSGTVYFAERQTAGRGRRGRDWLSPFACNVYGSMYWQFDLGPHALEGLAMAMGVAVLRVVHSVGVRDAKLKWPNDIFHQGRKLAGVLVELFGESGGPSHVVIGVGINVRMPAGIEPDQPWVDIVGATGLSVSRNRLAGELVSELAAAALRFQESGLAGFLPEWQQHDAIIGQDVIITSGDKRRRGRALGVDDSGALVVDHFGQVRRYLSGDVSLRTIS